MGDLTLQQVVLRIGAVLLIASVHGFAVAATACAMGDPGPRHDSRLGLNPLRHVDPIGGLLMVLFTVGWIRPVAVDPDRLRAGRVGLLAVVIAASCATLGLAVLLRLVRPIVLNMLPDTAASTLFIFVEIVGQLCDLLHAVQSAAGAAADGRASSGGGPATQARRASPRPALVRRAARAADCNRRGGAATRPGRGDHRATSCRIG